MTGVCRWEYNKLPKEKKTRSEEGLKKTLHFEDRTALGIVSSGTSIHLREEKKKVDSRYSLESGRQTTFRITHEEQYHSNRHMVTLFKYSETSKGFFKS